MSCLFHFCKKNYEPLPVENTITLPLTAIKRLPRLIHAVEQDSLGNVTKYVNEGDEINELDDHGEPALFHAIVESSPWSMKVVDFLLNNGAAVFQHNFQKSAVTIAVQRNQTHCLPTLLKYSGSCINSRSGPNSFTALHYAVAANRYEAAYLISQHPLVDFGALDRNGLKPHEVCPNSSVDSNIKAKTVVTCMANKDLGYGERQEILQTVGIDITTLPKFDGKLLDNSNDGGQNLIVFPDDLQQAKSECSQVDFVNVFLQEHNRPIKQQEPGKEPLKEVVLCPGCERQRFKDYSTNKRGEVWSDKLLYAPKPIEKQTTGLYGDNKLEWSMWHKNVGWSGEDYLRK